jgi:hypothetical protein
LDKFSGLKEKTQDPAFLSVGIGIGLEYSDIQSGHFLVISRSHQRNLRLLFACDRKLKVNQFPKTPTPYILLSLIFEENI